MIQNLTIFPLYFVQMGIFGPGGLRAPCVAWPLLSPTFALLSFFLFLRLLLLTHFGESPMCEIFKLKNTEVPTCAFYPLNVLPFSTFVNLTELKGTNV